MHSISKKREKRTRKASKPGANRGLSFDLRTYGVPGILALLLWGLVVFILHVGAGVSRLPLSEGQRAPATVIAQVDFESVDIAATEIGRQQAGDAIPPVFLINTAPLQSALRTLDLLLDRVVWLRTQTDRTALDEGEPWPDLDVPGVTFNTAEAMRLIPEGREEEFRVALRQALSSVWQRGIVSETDRESLFHGVASLGLVAIRDPEGTPGQAVEIASLPTRFEAMYAVIRMLRTAMPDAPIPERLLSSLLADWLQANLMYDRATTESMRLEAQRTVPLVPKKVRAGSTLMNQGDTIDRQRIEDWRAHDKRMNELRSPHDRRMALAGRAILLLFALIICAGLLRTVRPDAVASPRYVLLLMLISLLTIAPSKGLLFYVYENTEWLSATLMELVLPLALAPLLTTLLLGSGAALVMGVWTSFSVAIMFENSFTVLVMGLLVSVLAAYAARDVRKRSSLIRVGFWIGVAQMLYGISYAILQQYPLPLASSQAMAAFFSGIIVALITLMVLPIFESLFRLTTDITLLELSDMGHPLLQRLAMEAPGTYHHSLMVANLAQSAASEIGANALLLRVCAYYHDIGKLTKPDFFIENTQFRENPHDSLAPSMSTLVIISHVKEGVSMAMRNKLPTPIIEAIQQHHGTSLVSYFYHRAKTIKAEEGDATPLSEGDFRYPGPRPRTREMGILLLADSIEAASRSMDKSSPSRIENLVSEIIDAYLHDGQLDECDLTFAQLHVIRRSFVFTLTNMLHGRVPYPKDETGPKQSTDKISPAPASVPDLS